jgi:hypothetical protein
MGFFDKIFGKSSSPARPPSVADTKRITFTIEYPNGTRISFAHCTNEVVPQITELIKQGSFDEHSIGILATLLFQCGASVQQVEAHMDEYRPLYRANLERLSTASPNWATADQESRAIILEKLKPEATKKLPLAKYRNGRTRVNVLSSLEKASLVRLLEGPPSPLERAPEIVRLFDGPEQFQYNIKFYDARGPGSVHIVPESDYYRKRFIALTLTRLATKGNDVPILDLASLLGLRQLRTLLSELSGPKVKSTADAVDALRSIPDVEDRIHSLIPISDVFQLQPLPEGLDIATILRAWYYYRDIADVVGTITFHSS